MGKIVVTEFISIDGVIGDPGGAEGTQHGGWSFAVSRGADGDEFKLDETLGSAALLLGRKTYEGFAQAWPRMTDDVGFADKFNTMPKYVVSSTLADPQWTNSKVISLDEVPSVKDQLDGELVVHGSGRLVQALLERDLVDELRLMVYPFVLGDGQRLFGDMPDKLQLRLAGTETVGDGVVVLTYVKP